MQNQKKVAGKNSKAGKGVTSKKGRPNKVEKAGKGAEVGKGKKLMNKKTEIKGRPNAKKKLKLAESGSDSSQSDAADENDECFYCNESSAVSIDGWIRCEVCSRWAHDVCAGVEDDDDDFICEFCK